MSKSPEAIVAERAKDDSQGMLGFLKTVNKKFSINLCRDTFQGKFPIMNEQEIASASANDRSQPWQEHRRTMLGRPRPGRVHGRFLRHLLDWCPRRTGKDLPRSPARERRAMKVFGYNQTEDEKPFIRLACQAQAAGNVTIVIPPWNAVFGKKVYGNVEELELEPVTTSAKALRETIASATSAE